MALTNMGFKTKNLSHLEKDQTIEEKREREEEEEEEEEGRRSSKLRSKVWN